MEKAVYGLIIFVIIILLFVLSGSSTPDITCVSNSGELVDPVYNKTTKQWECPARSCLGEEGVKTMCYANGEQWRPTECGDDGTWTCDGQKYNYKYLGCYPGSPNSIAEKTVYGARDQTKYPAYLGDCLSMGGDFPYYTINAGGRGCNKTYNVDFNSLPEQTTCSQKTDELAEFVGKDNNQVALFEYLY